MSELSKQLRDASERPTRNDLSIGHYWNFCSDAADQIERLERELAQARQDAARYRWLRDVGDSTWCPLLEHSRLAFPHVPVNELPSMIDEIISAAIDAAMKEEK